MIRADQITETRGLAILERLNFVSNLVSLRGSHGHERRYRLFREIGQDASGCPSRVRPG